MDTGGLWESLVGAGDGGERGPYGAGGFLGDLLAGQEFFSHYDDGG